MSRQGDILALLTRHRPLKHTDVREGVEWGCRLTHRKQFVTWKRENDNYTFRALDIHTQKPLALILCFGHSPGLHIKGVTGLQLVSGQVWHTLQCCQSVFHGHASFDRKSTSNFSFVRSWMKCKVTCSTLCTCETYNTQHEETVCHITIRVWDQCYAPRQNSKGPRLLNGTRVQEAAIKANKR